MSLVRLIAACSILLPLVSAGAVQAGGFYIKEQSAEGLGRAFAGSTAFASDASIVYYNPAAMTQIDQLTATVGVYALFLDSMQENLGTTRTFPGIPGEFPVIGGDGGNPFDQPVAVGNFYAAMPVKDNNLWVGLGVNSPFGLNNKYDGDFFGRYDSRKSLLFTINIQPSMAYKLTENISIGAGLDIEYAEVTLTNALPNLSPDLPDGQFRVEGNDWALGWNVGVLFDLGDMTLGAHYRAPIDHTIRGELEIRGLLGPLLPVNGIFEGSARLNLPDLVTAGFVYQAPDKPYRILGDISWFNWSDFEQIRIKTNAGTAFVSPQGYRNTWSVAIGGEYDWDDALTLRIGAQYDETPTRDRFRTTRVPDGDRWWATAGATYNFSDQFSAVLSYAHVFVTSERINLTTPFFEGTPAQINVNTLSTNSGSADIVAVGATLKF